MYIITILEAGETLCTLQPLPKYRAEHVFEVFSAHYAADPSLKVRVHHAQSKIDVTAEFIALKHSRATLPLLRPRPIHHG